MDGQDLKSDQHILRLSLARTIHIGAKISKGSMLHAARDLGNCYKAASNDTIYHVSWNLSALTFMPMEWLSNHKTRVSPHVLRFFSLLYYQYHIEIHADLVDDCRQLLLSESRFKG